MTEETPHGSSAKREIHSLPRNGILIFDFNPHTSPAHPSSSPGLLNRQSTPQTTHCLGGLWRMWTPWAAGGNRPSGGTRLQAGCCHVGPLSLKAQKWAVTGHNPPWSCAGDVEHKRRSTNRNEHREYRTNQTPNLLQ